MIYVTLMVSCVGVAKAKVGSHLGTFFAALAASSTREGRASTEQ